MQIDTPPGSQATITGDPLFPVSQGRLCVKGFTAASTLAHPERLTRPLSRTATGELVPVSWDDALGRVAKILRLTQDRYGPDAVGVALRC